MSKSKDSIYKPLLTRKRLQSPRGLSAGEHFPPQLTLACLHHQIYWFPRAQRDLSAVPAPFLTAAASRQELVPDRLVFGGDRFFCRGPCCQPLGRPGGLRARAHLRCWVWVFCRRPCTPSHSLRVRCRRSSF